MNDTEIIKTILSADFLTGFTTGGILLFIVFIICIKNPIAVQKWLSFFWKLLSYVYKKAEYWSIKDDIEWKINHFVKSIEEKTSISKYPKISINWIAQDGKLKEGLFFEEDKAILVMRDQNHITSNIVHATYIFTSETLLRKSKKHLSKNQKKCIDLCATQEILKEQQSSAVELFVEEYIVPYIENNENAKVLIKKIKKIQEVGIFFPILIQELSRLGGKAFLDNPDQKIIQEVADLLEYLKNFSERELGDIETPKSFVGNYTKCSIEIVASRQKRQTGATEKYITTIKEKIESGFENIYVLGGATWENKRFIKKVCEGVKSGEDSIVIHKEYTFKGQVIKNKKKIPVETHLVHIHNPDALEYFIYED